MNTNWRQQFPPSLQTGLSKRRGRGALLGEVLLMMMVMLWWIAAGTQTAFAQSRRVPPVSQQKKNQRPVENGEPPPPQGDKPAEALPPQEVVNTPQDADEIKITTAVVNVDAVVYNKKTGQIVTGLKRDNFTVFEDGVKQNITNFSTPEAPITVAMVLEYSKLTSSLNANNFDYGLGEVLRPMALFLSGFVKPPEDFVTVIAYDIRPTPITDFTNDPRQINATINLLLRNQPAYSEANLFDALKFTLVGGRGDTEVLQQTKTPTNERKQDYTGLAGLQNRRKAVILVTSGIDTFSKINLSQIRKIVQNAGVPIYIIGTSELFFKKYGDQLGPTDDLLGNPGRLTMLQARNQLNTFAKESGGGYYPVTFESQVPSVLQTINALMRNQYSIGYRATNKEGNKQRKLKVSVDVDGDGTLDDKLYEVKHRPFYNPAASKP